MCASQYTEALLYTWTGGRWCWPVISLSVRLRCSSGRRHARVVSVMFNPIHSVGYSIIRSRTMYYSITPSIKFSIYNP